MSIEFETALGTFLAGCERIVDRNLDTDRHPGDITLFHGQHGRRYVRVVGTRRNGSSCGVHCFVDKTNGDVLKAASWKAPAKHARGNIYDEHNGLAQMGAYGPQYLR